MKDDEQIMGRRRKDILNRLFPSFALFFYYLSLLVSWYTYKGPGAKEGHYIISAQLSLLLVIDDNILSAILPFLVAIAGLIVILISLNFNAPRRRWKTSPILDLAVSLTGMIIMSSSIFFALIFGFEVANGIAGLRTHAIVTIVIISIGILGIISYAILSALRNFNFTRSISDGIPKSFLKIPLIISGIISIVFPIIAIIYLPVGSGQRFGVGSQLCLLVGGIFMGIPLWMTFRDSLTKRNFQEYFSLIGNGSHKEASDLMLDMGCQHKAAESQAVIGMFEDAARNFETDGFDKEAREIRSRWIWKQFSTYGHANFEMERPKSLIRPRAIVSFIFIVLAFFLLLFALSQPVWLSWDYDEDVEPDPDDYRSDDFSNYHICYHKDSGPFRANITYESWGVYEDGNTSEWVGYTYSDSDQLMYNETRKYDMDITTDLPLCSIFLLALFPMLLILFLFIVPFILVLLGIWSGNVPAGVGLIMAFIMITALFMMTVAYSYEEYETWTFEWADQYESFPPEVERGLILSFTVHPGFIALWISPFFFLLGSILSFNLKPIGRELKEARRYIYTLNLREAQQHYYRAGMKKTSDRLRRILDPTIDGIVKI